MEKLVETGFLEPHGTGQGRTYTLSAALYRKAGRKSEYIRQAGFAPIQQEQMVLNYIDKHNSIKRADVMELCHLTQDQAYKLLLRLKKRGEIFQIGERKGAIYKRKHYFMRSAQIYVPIYAPAHKKRPQAQQDGWSGLEQQPSFTFFRATYSCLPSVDQTLKQAMIFYKNSYFQYVTMLCRA